MMWHLKKLWQLFISLPLLFFVIVISNKNGGYEDLLWLFFNQIRNICSTSALCGKDLPLYVVDDIKITIYFCKPKIGFRSYLIHPITIYLRPLILLASLPYLSTLRETNMKNGIKSPSLIPRSGKRNALVLKTWSYGNAKRHSTCNMVFDQFCLNIWYIHYFSYITKSN